MTRVILVTTLLAALYALNVSGVKESARVIGMITVAKLVPLCLFVIAGGFVLLLRHQAIAAQPAVVAGLSGWVGATLLPVYLLAGFESALIPMSEAANPKRDAPFALLVTMIVAVARQSG